MRWAFGRGVLLMEGRAERPRNGAETGLDNSGSNLILSPRFETNRIVPTPTYLTRWM
jgi:hypothetical protein